MKIIKVILKGIGWIAVAAVTVVLSIIFGIDYLMERAASKTMRAKFRCDSKTEFSSQKLNLRP
jgi:hypothetical protein